MIGKEPIEEKLEELGRSIGTDESLAEKVMKRIEAEPDKSEQFRRAKARRVIFNRFVKLAAAACLIITVFAGISHFIGTVDVTTVALGEVLKQIEQAESFTYKMKAKMTGAANVPKGKTLELEANVYVYSGNVIRTDGFMGGKLMSQTYVVPTEKAVFSVMPEQRKYMRLNLTDELLEKQLKKDNDPRYLLKKIINLKYVELGRKTIDGVEVAGIESTDPKAADGMFDKADVRIWVDVKTDLPVLEELKYSSSDETTVIEVVASEYNWNPGLAPSFFEPNIPNDYELLAEMQVPDSNEGTLVQGLRTFAELTGGRYPSSLTLMAVMKEAGKMMGEEIGNDPNKPPSKESLVKMMKIQATCGFYSQLVKGDKDVAYYGDKITSADANAVLVRWKISENEYRVIFGDLTAKDVNAERLAELEK